MHSMDEKQRFIELRAKGMSFNNIAKELGVAKQTLINWSKELRLEVSNLRAMELEELQQKYHMTTVKRIELFGEKLNAIAEELETRDWHDIPTVKLLELLEKYAAVLKQEEVPTSFGEATDDLMGKLTELGTYIDRWTA